MSLRPVLENPATSVKSAAFTQHPRPAYYQGDDPKVMGYSIRGDRYRYNEWLDFKTGEIVARELYDHAPMTRVRQSTSSAATKTPQSFGGWQVK